jgi:hypothetical protein
VTDEKLAKPAKKATEPEALVSPDVALGNVAEDRLVTVRTTMRPDQDLRVSRAEARDLEAQGLIPRLAEGEER